VYVCVKVNKQIGREFSPLCFELDKRMSQGPLLR